MTNVSELPKQVQNCIEFSIKPKFNGYFEFTRDTCRSIPQSGDQSCFVYPNNSMISDITILWALLNELYESINNSSGNIKEEQDNHIEKLFELNEDLKTAFLKIFTEGEYWRTDDTKKFKKAEFCDQIPEVWKTLRNSNSHYDQHLPHF